MYVQRCCELNAYWTADVERYTVIGAEIQCEVVRRASDADMFTLMTGETTDVSHKCRSMSDTFTKPAAAVMN